MVIVPAPLIVTIQEFGVWTPDEKARHRVVLVHGDNVNAE